MAAKNETTVLISSLLVTVGLIGGGLLWFNQSSNTRESSLLSTQSIDRFAEAKNVPSGLFNYGGSTTWAPIRKEVDAALQIVWTGFSLRYTDPIVGTPGSGSGIRMLLKNQLSFAQSSRPLKDEEYQQAQQAGFTLKEVPVAIDGIAVAVHPDLEIAGITVAQLADIYLGKITNWQTVGGPDLPIVPYSRRLEDGGTIDFFVENVMNKQAFGTPVQFVSNTTQALRTVTKTPGAIYYASAPEVIGQCGPKPLPLGKSADKFVPPYQLPIVPPSQCPAQRNRLNIQTFQTGDYPLTRRLFVIIKQNGQADQQAGEAYASLMLTNQGQSLLAQAGFVRLR